MVGREDDGREHALGPLAAALVRAALGAEARMRRERAYQLRLHVKGSSVVVQVVRHVGDVAYTPGPGPDTAATD